MQGGRGANGLVLMAHGSTAAPVPIAVPPQPGPLRRAEPGALRAADLRRRCVRAGVDVELAHQVLEALGQRARRDGFQLTLLAPLAPIDRAIQICGLDQTLPFAAPMDALDIEPANPHPRLMEGRR